MLRKLLSEALALVDFDRPGARAWLERAAAYVFQPVVPGTPARAGRNPRLAPWQARRVSAFITERLETSIRVEELAALTRLTPGYFSKAFRGAFGLAPHAYVVERRMVRARELMIQTELPLAAIALACGLYDQAHLTRVFRKRYGMAPAAWRRSQQGAPAPLAP